MKDQYTLVAHQGLIHVRRHDMLYRTWCTTWTADRTFVDPETPLTCFRCMVAWEAWKAMFRP